jgi:hypothetical protein
MPIHEANKHSCGVEKTLEYSIDMKDTAGGSRVTVYDDAMPVRKARYAQLWSGEDVRLHTGLATKTPVEAELGQWHQRSRSYMMKGRMRVLESRSPLRPMGKGAKTLVQEAPGKTVVYDGPRHGKQA